MNVFLNILYKVFDIKVNKNMTNVRVYRTTEGTIFECVAAVIIVVMWALIAYYFKSLPDQIPTHFDMTGDADGFGSKHTLWILGIIGTLTTTLLLFSAYHPRFMNLPVKVTKPVHIAMAIRMLRIICIIIALLFVDIVLMIVSNPYAYVIVMWCLIAAMLAVMTYYSVRIRKTTV
ncbi:MAG: DUF1648 domain-containing protein [Prevotella sp.]|nr:DUF1648 domain-containing protein [Prevotella sp.]